jgi:signal transduction histidine kinase
MMINSILSPKWREFHSSLASMLNLMVAVVTPEGVTAFYNTPPLFDKLDRYPQLFTAYKDFLLRIPFPREETGNGQVIYDPLGLPVFVCDFFNGEFFLLLVGGLDKGNPQCRQDFQACLEAYGVGEHEELSGEFGALTVDELVSKSGSVKALYLYLLRSLNESKELGERMLLLTAVEEINKLMLQLFSSEYFDLKRILELVASSLVILSDADGSWVFTHCRTVSPLTVLRGQRSDCLQELEKSWSAAVNRQEDPLDSVNELITQKKGEPGIKLENIFFSSKRESRISLGVLNPRDKSVQAVLAAFIKQVAIALEVADLYEVLQRQIGMVLNSIRHGVIVFNADRKTMMVNQAAAKIIAAQGIILQPGQPLEGQGLSRDLETAIISVLKNGDAHIQRQTVLEQEGNLLHLRWDAVPLLSDKIIMGAMLIFEDITETVNQISRMEDWERLATVGEVAAGLAHEIRNPLATAGAAIQLFARMDDEDKRRELISKINLELERINKILGDFLNISKARQMPALQPICLAQVIQELKFLIISEVHLKNLKLVCSDLAEPDDSPMVLGDRNGLKQVILNIVKNAVEACPAGGRLEMSLHRDTGHAWITVKDNGPGISRETLSKVLRPFFTTKNTGTGLGLSISASIMKRMGGELRIESEPGSGTSVHIILPLAPEN